MGIMLGGLNGDGFFNEEYEGYEDGEYSGGYEIPKSIKDFSMTKTGLETEKGVQYNVLIGIGEFLITIWMPKSVMTKPHHESIEPCGISILYKNIKTALKKLAEEKNYERS